MCFPFLFVSLTFSYLSVSFSFYRSLIVTLGCKFKLLRYFFGPIFQHKNLHLIRYCTLFRLTSHKIIIIIKLRWTLFVTYTIIQSITSSEMCSLRLIHPSAPTWSSGQPTLWRPGSSWGSVPCSRVSPQSWTIPAGAGIRTHNRRSIN